MLDEPLIIVAVLAANMALSEWLARRTVLRHLGSALLVIVITAITANAGLIPTFTVGSPVYDSIFATVAPLAIFWLLLGVSLRHVLRAGAPMLALFSIGALGTVLGVVAGTAAFGGEQAFGAMHHALAGMFVGTYIGGSINFNAIALEYGVVQDGPLYAGASVVDSAMTTIWMAATVALPRLLSCCWPAGKAAPGVPATDVADDHDDREAVDPLGIALLLALGAASVAVSDWVAARLAAGGVRVPSILVLTTIALVLAQWPPIQRIRGARVCGLFAVMIFLAVIGALCDVAALARLGPLGPSLILFVTVAVTVHGVVIFGAAALLRLDVTMAAVASQANIGGGTSALALARSLGRPDLVLPSILIGSLGNAAGTYLGFLVAGALR